MDMSNPLQLLIFTFLDCVFQDLKMWQEKYLILEDMVSFLVAISEDSVGDELKCEFTRISKKWKKIMDVSNAHIKSFSKLAALWLLTPPPPKYDFSGLFHKILFSSKKLSNKKIFKTSSKKGYIHFCYQKPIPNKRDLAPRNGFSWFSQKILLFFCEKTAE